MKVILFHLFLALLLVGGAQLQAATIIYDGTAADGFWTNGPQDPNGGAFPQNAGQGANWTINAGTPGQIVTPDAGTPGNNRIDYTYSGHDWEINGFTVNEDIQVKLDGGSLQVTDSSLSLLPSSATTPTAGLSGLNLGQNGNATTATFTRSTVNVSRSNFAGRGMGLIGGSSLALFGSSVNVSAESGNSFVDLNNGSTLTLDPNSSLTATGQLDLFGAANTVSMAAGASLDVLYLRANSGGETTQNLMVGFAGGTFTVNDPNPFRDNSSFEGQFDFTGPQGSGKVVHTNLSSNNTNLAGKTAQGFFSIDGTRINPPVNNTLDWTNPANVATLNSELESLAVNGKFLKLFAGGGEQVLTIVPEPTTTSLALVGLAGLMVRRRRR